MAPDEQTANRPILRFYVSMRWDARSHSIYVYAPDDWGEMDEAARENFCEEQARQWALEDIEIGGAEYDPAEGDYGRWEDGNPSEPEEWF